MLPGHSRSPSTVHNGSCILDSAPPDVPPRNPSMSRINGRPGGLLGSMDRDGDFEPSCLVRTPSGNVYIPSDIPVKNSPLDYKSNSSCSSPSKALENHQQKNTERCSLPFGTPVPVLPVRNNLRRPNSSHFPPARFQFRKGFTKCSWKCTAIVFIILSIVLLAAVTYMSAANFLDWSYQNSKACSVVVGENTDVSYPKPAAELPQTQNRSSVIQDIQKPPPLPTGGREQRDVTSRNYDLKHSRKIRVRRELSNTHDEVVEALKSPRAQQHEHEQGVLNVVSKDTGVASVPEDGMRKLSFMIPPDEIPMQLPRQITYPPWKKLFRPQLEKSDDSGESGIKNGPARRQIRHSKAGKDEHDYHVFSYGAHEFEIVELDEDFMDANLTQERTNTHEMHDPQLTISNDASTKGKVTETVTSKADTSPKVTEIPVEGARHSKRVLVNVTIETEDEEEGLKPVYVVSLSVPTDIVEQSTENNLASRVDVTPKTNPTTPVTKASVAPTSTTTRFGYYYGGQCECSCPCLESDSSTEDDGEEDTSTSTTNTDPTEEGNFSTTTDGNMVDGYNVTESYWANGTTEAFTESTTEEETPTTSTSVSMCPAVTPPPPMILLLEEAKTFPMKSFPPEGTTFGQINLGQKMSKVIPGYGYWNMQFFQSEAAYMKFDFLIPRGSSIGVYARRDALPTHTQYDILEVLNGFKAKEKRASNTGVKKDTKFYMEQGHWFVSLYNDDGDAQEITFTAEVAEEMTQNCPNGCSGKGECLMGHCQCNAGFGGDDCSESVCPVLCSQRGEYINGECQCNPGWKGKECSLRHDECEVPDCNGHGHCVSGKCACVGGYKGKFCEEVDCPHPTCSGHGFCMEGSCICKKGWKGSDCAIKDLDALQCLPDCSGHGNFDVETQTCICKSKWSGDDCSKELCDLDCGPNGHCVGDSCVCNSGWYGEFCNIKQCDPRCNEHGQCKNGTCLCVTGFIGKHCTLEGCPAGCSGHGQCRVNRFGTWECGCYDGWSGRDCSIVVEQNCNDGRDNDKDGLVDCEDPDCCTNQHICKNNQHCVTVPKPIDVLLRRQPALSSSTFFEKIKFMIVEGSVQNYARYDSFNESVFWSHFNASRVGIVRGKVTTMNGLPLIGVRVSTSIPLQGFTLTRLDGWFDLLVNGGGSVILQFGRSPFRPQSRIVTVPWNEMVIIDTVVMGMGDEKPPPPGPHLCTVHDYDTMKPVILSTWKHEYQGGCPDKNGIVAENQIVQETLLLQGTGVNLVYVSSRQPGYLSTITLLLTPEVIPPSLKLIHLRISVEGNLFEKTFEADPEIKYTYGWNRVNHYRQKIYGVSTAVIKVGYEYTDCKDIIWDVQTAKLAGIDMAISDVSGFNLDVHHRYHPYYGVLHKGDGTNVYLKHKPKIIVTTMGDGHQRPLDCFDCDGHPAKKQRLLAPVALAPAADGSLFVGDFNLIRKILTDGTVRTVVRLNATRVSYRYHIALSPLDGTVYISDPESHQIIKVRDVNDYSDPDHNWEPAVGSGERCLPGDEAHCGDGALARDAKLAYPKGIAISSDNILYFADGTNIRMVDHDGIITTVIGNHMHKSHWKPIPCSGTLNLEEVHLRWPTELAINPLDDSLYLIDDHMILRFVADGRVKVVAGRPLHCPSPKGGYRMDLAAHATLVMPQSIAFAFDGDLYLAESDSQRINRIRVIGTDGKITSFAGAESKCNCLDRGCDCFQDEHFLASAAKFNTISCVTVTPDGVVHIADQANYRIRSVTSVLPRADSKREYEIPSPETQEIYTFNRFGQHVSTKSLITREILYVFMYTVNTSLGKLSTVTDAAGNKIFLLRDYTTSVTSIENTRGYKCRVRQTRMRMVREISTSDNYNVTFDYIGQTGLVKAKYDSTGRSYVYNYDEFGRVKSIVMPTGRMVKMEVDLNLNGCSVKATRTDRRPITAIVKGPSVQMKIGEAVDEAVLQKDGTTWSKTAWGRSVLTESVPHNVLSELDALQGEYYPAPSKQKTEITGDLTNRFEWRFFLRKITLGKVPVRGTKTVVQMGRRLRVNGENTLSLEYDKETRSIAMLLGEDKLSLLNLTYDKTFRPMKWAPKNGIFSSVQMEYDRFSRLIKWSWGDYSLRYFFDRTGRLNEIKFSDDSTLTYAFKDLFGTLPSKVTTPRGSDYLIQYDDAGAVSSITTPRGHIHSFALQTSLGFFKYQYFAPTNRHPFELIYNDEGQILARAMPHQTGKVVYVYDPNGKLETILSGLTSIHYTYQESTGLLRAVDVAQPNFEMKIEYRYHSGQIKDERVKFGSKSGLNNAHYKYQFDGSSRLSGIEVELNGKELPLLRIKNNQNVGYLEGIADLRMYRNTFNRSVLQDNAKQFFTITDVDRHGRLKTVLMNIKGFDVYRMELEYDNRNRITSYKLLIGRTNLMDRITYNADGHVMEVVGTSNWKYVYDENGNAVAIYENGEKTTLGYDSGDRVVQFGDVEFNGYDGRGFVVRRGDHKYRYNSLGQITYAYERERFASWYYYDDRGRLISWHDDRGNVTQYFYAHPGIPDCITHVHFPKTGRTFRFLYNEEERLITVETTEQRFYAALDQNASPLALFDTNGNIIKEIRRTPFGKIVKDSNPDFYLPVDYRGGLLDPNTGLVYLKKRWYDPLVGQWMTPDWENIVSRMFIPTSLFAYRFMNNDPINPKNPNDVPLMTDLLSWYKLYGYDIKNMMGGIYTHPYVYRPTAVVTAPQLITKPHIMSGQKCLVDRISEEFYDIELVPEPQLKEEPRIRDLIEKVACRRGVFGEGILISRVDGRALVSVVAGVNTVVQDVVTSVFNNSHFLDLHFSVHDQDVFYFVKDNPLKIRDDLEELRRLGGMFNVSTHEVTEHGSQGAKELRLHNPDAAVFVRYGADPEQERHRLLKHAHKRAVERAWELEKQLVAAGLQGRGDWSEEEKEELLLHGEVDTYEGTDIHNPHKYPQLADDPGNIAFKRDSKRKRRKIGHKSGRSHRHDT